MPWDFDIGQPGFDIGDWTAQATEAERAAVVVVALLALAVVGAIGYVLFRLIGPPLLWLVEHFIYALLWMAHPARAITLVAALALLGYIFQSWNWGGAAIGFALLFLWINAGGM